MDIGFPLGYVKFDAIRASGSLTNAIASAINAKKFFKNIHFLVFMLINQLIQEVGGEEMFRRLAL